jgi:anti-sigma regulatory factor (Ser/Thr protein kinase)
MTTRVAALPVTRTIAVSNQIEDLPRIYDALEAAASEAQLSETLGRTLLLVSEELFSNIVRYGYPAGADDQIEFTADCRQDAVVLTFVDHALAFDHGRAPPEPADRPIDAMEPGGLGLFLVHHFAKSLLTRRDGDANVTEVILIRD